MDNTFGDIDTVEKLKKLYELQYDRYLTQSLRACLKLKKINVCSGLELLSAEL